MRCEEVRELLPDAAGGMVTAPVTAAVAEHLAVCHACRAELALLRAVAALPVPGPTGVPWMDGAWEEDLPAAVLAEAARRERALLEKVASLPVPVPDQSWSDSLPGLVRKSVAAAARGEGRSRLPAAVRAPWWWAGGAVAAAAALLLAVRIVPAPLAQAADEEFVLAVNSSPVWLGHAADLAVMGGEGGEAGPDWLEGLETVDLEEMEDGDFYRSPVPPDWDDGDDRGDAGADGDRGSSTSMMVTDG
jgi:hypothetical protein